MGTDYVGLELKGNSELLSMAQNVYAHLNDEISKKIFEARTMFAMTGDMGRMLDLEKKYRNLSSDIEVYADKIKHGSHCLVYGAGKAGHYLAMRFKNFGVKIDAFIESDESFADLEAKMDKTQSICIDELTGIRIIPEKELHENKSAYSDKTVVISYPNMQVANDIKKRLCDGVGIKEENIAMRLFDWRNNSAQYFDFFDPGENEVFVDCGCYDGGSCYRFVGWCGQKGYEHIYSFEADPKNYEKCKALLEPLGKCELFHYGTAKEREKVYFASKAFEDSCIISEEEAQKRNFEGAEMIETVALDEVLAGKRITFLKMDVEGAEYDALLGAETLIKENRPRMAISIYQKPEDFIILADLVLKMHSDYKISFRHYGLDELETIMYVE